MLTSTIEAMIFASGQGLTKEEVLQFFIEQYSAKEILAATDAVLHKYNDQTAGVIIKVTNGRMQMQTNPEFSEKVGTYLLPVKEKQLSKSLLESLAIIAYRQPITKMEIEDIRRVNSDYAVGLLENAGLIFKSGQKASLGRPYQYSTTDEFLKRFGLESLADLPDQHELLAKIRNNFDKYHAETENLLRFRTIDGEDGELAVAADDSEFAE